MIELLLLTYISKTDDSNPFQMATQNEQTRLCDLNDDILWQVFKFIPVQGLDVLHEASDDWMKETIELFWWTEVKHLTISEAQKDVCEIKKWVKRCPNIRTLYYDVDGVMLQNSCESMERLTKLEELTIDLRPKIRLKEPEYIYARDLDYFIRNSMEQILPSLVSLNRLQFIFLNWTYFNEESYNRSPYCDFRFGFEKSSSVYPDNEEYRISLKRM